MLQAMSGSGKAHCGQVVSGFIHLGYCLVDMPWVYTVNFTEFLPVFYRICLEDYSQFIALFLCFELAHRVSFVSEDYVRRNPSDIVHA